MWQVEPRGAPASDTKNLRRHLQAVRNKVSPQIRLVEDDENCIGYASRKMFERAS